MVADEFYDGKPWIDLSEHEIKKGLESLLALMCRRPVMWIFAARSPAC